MHTITITKDKPKGQFQVHLKSYIRVFGVKFCYLTLTYRGPYKWCFNLSYALSVNYKTPVIYKIT